MTMQEKKDTQQNYNSLNYTQRFNLLNDNNNNMLLLVDCVGRKEHTCVRVYSCNLCIQCHFSFFSYFFCVCAISRSLMIYLNSK